MRHLNPPLTVIEDYLPTPSQGPLRRWLADQARQRASAIAAPESATTAGGGPGAVAASTAGPDLGAGREPRLPDHLRELISRRVASRTRRFSAVPAAGQVLGVDQVVGPGGPLGWDVPSPLAVLIDTPTAVAGIWRGWLVSPEVEYASWWDCLLEDEDGPHDPLAGMVQIWNPVEVYLPSTSGVLAELPPDRLAALRALAAERLRGEEPDVALARPGALAEWRTRDGHRVLTGTPLGGAEDPRHRYQALYLAAAGALAEPVRLAAAAPPPSDRSGILPADSAWADVERWLEAIGASARAAAQATGLAWRPEPVRTMGETAPTEPQPAFEVGDLVRVRVHPVEPGTVVKLSLRLIADRTLVARMLEAGSARQTRTLTPEQPEVDLWVRRETGFVLEVQDASGATLWRWELPF